MMLYLTALILEAGCVSQPSPDPLAGWKILLSRDSEKLDKAIKDDYRSYIQEILAPKKLFIDEEDIWFYTDDFGQHAVRIEVPKNGNYYEYVLIYDKNNSRVKTLKYFGGRYRS